MSNLQRFSKKQTANRPTSTIFWIKPTTNQPPSMRVVEGMLVVLRVAAARQPKLPVVLRGHGDEIAVELAASFAVLHVISKRGLAAIMVQSLPRAH